METAILSDIHANLEALRAVLKDIKNHNIKGKHCLGDIIGYGPDPLPCIAALRNPRNNFTFVLSGNHEDITCHTEKNMEKYKLDKNAIESLKWTKNRIFYTNPDIFTYFRNLPCTNIPGDEKRIVEVHGGLSLDETARETALDAYSTNSPPAKAGIPSQETNNLLQCFSSLKKLNRQVCFVGHTHCAEAFEISPESGNEFMGINLNLGNNYDEPAEAHIKLKENSRYVVNPGSVGQPRDLDTRASYCIYSGDKITFRKIPYDYLFTVQKLSLRIGLKKEVAKQLAKRLFLGC